MAHWREALLTGVAAIAIAALLPPTAKGQTPAPDRGAAPSSAAAEPPVRPYSQSAALVIGITEYKNGWKSLPKAVPDAEAVAEALRQSGFETVRLFTSAQTEVDPTNREIRRPVVLTGDRIFQLIRDFLLEFGHDSEARLFIWFAGHGDSIESDRPTGKIWTGYLVGSEAANPGAAAGPRDPRLEAEMRRGAVSLEQIGALLQDLPAKHIMAVFDSCFAGTIFAGFGRDGEAPDAPATPRSIRTALSEKTRLFLTSGSARQAVRDDAKFRQLFVDALLGRIQADRNGDGYLTGKELGLFLEQAMSDDKKAEHTPQFGPMYGWAASKGDIVFRISPDAMARLREARPDRPPGELLHERFWGFVRDEKSPPLIDRYVAAFPETPFKETALAHAKQLRQPVTVASKGPNPKTGGPAEPDKPTFWWRKPGDPAPTDWFEVPVLFGTDRTQKGAEFGGERGNRLALGGVVVTVPAAHKSGEVERAFEVSTIGIAIYREKADPAKHFTARPPIVMKATDFTAAAKGSLARAAAPREDALLFVHGYNTKFEEAAFRAAQLAFDLGFDGPVLLYSWPSSGGLTGYVYDRESSQSSTPFLRSFLQRIGGQTGIKKVHIIAHNMGVQPVLQVVKDAAANPLPNLRIGQVILAAPDMDREEFRNLCGQAATAAEGMTLYATAGDKALEASRRVAGGAPRAGEVGSDGPLVAPCIRTVEIGSAGSPLQINHSSFSRQRVALDDIKGILTAGGLDPGRRNPIAKQVTGPAGTYWRLE